MLCLRCLKIAFFFCPLTFFFGGGGGGSQGAGAGANRVGAKLFCVIKNEGLHKVLQPFLKGHVFFAFQFPSYKKETTKEESITRQILSFFLSK